MYYRDARVCAGVYPIHPAAHAPQAARAGRLRQVRAPPRFNAHMRTCIRAHAPQGVVLFCFCIPKASRSKLRQIAAIARASQWKQSHPYYHLCRTWPPRPLRVPQKTEFGNAYGIGGMPPIRASQCDLSRSEEGRAALTRVGLRAWNRRYKTSKYYKEQAFDEVSAMEKKTKKENKFL